VEMWSVDEVMQVLSESFDMITTIVSESGGTIDKYIGDSVMAFWNSHHTPLQDHPLRALLACLRAQRELRRMRAKWQEKKLPPLAFCVGLSTGEALMGYVGCAARLNYTVMGRPVNLASRLEKLNRDCGTSILVDRSVYLRTKHCFAYERLGGKQLKGFDGIVEVFEPLYSLTNPKEQ